MSSIAKYITPNRVAAVATWLASLAALIAAVVGTFPAGWQNAALGVAALLTKLVVALKFIDGGQKWEQLVGRQQIVAAQTLGTGVSQRQLTPVVESDEGVAAPTEFESALENVDHDFAPDAAGHPTPVSVLPGRSEPESAAKPDDLAPLGPDLPEVKP